MSGRGDGGAGWVARIPELARTLFWVIAIVLFARQVMAPAMLAGQRTAALAALEKARGSRAIAMIHRQEQVSLFGIPVSSYITIDDSESILRAIRRTPPDRPIDLILHTPGGLVLAAQQIAQALAAHPAPVTVMVPHYAMSGGTLIALAADEVIMDANAVLGPVDPQIGQWPAASIVRVVQQKPIAEIDDETLILADVSAKARRQVEAFVRSLLVERMPPPQAAAVARTLSEGRWTHDYPITVAEARAFGLKVSTDMPREVYALMDLYPQAGAGRPSVLYVPGSAERAGGGEATGTADGRAGR